MNTSPTSVQSIAGFEGCRLSPYNDVSGNATVGIGHLLHRGPLNGTEVSLTEAEALSLFAQDLKSRAEIFIPTFVKVPLSQNQFDALVSFTYNLGPYNLKNLVSETGLNVSGYSSVPGEILHYDKARIGGVLQPVPGLTRRRQWEAQLWNTVDNPSPSVVA